MSDVSGQLCGAAANALEALAAASDTNSYMPLDDIPRLCNTVAEVFDILNEESEDSSEYNPNAAAQVLEALTAASAMI